MTIEIRDTPTGWRHRLHEIIFEADTTAGKIFDISLILCIFSSVLVVMLDSVEEYHEQNEALLNRLEWIFTILFTIEYGLRLISVQRPLLYAKSFFGVVDLLSILPTYLAPFTQGTHFAIVFRLLRIMRVFRVLKLTQYVGEAHLLVQSLKASRRKLIVFLFGVLTIVTIFGSIMYLIEGQENEQFSSIPKSVYWAIVTVTTVGYGDISPHTPWGQAASSCLMILGYAIIAVPTGIVTAALTKTSLRLNTQACLSCGADGHDDDAVHCKYCGGKI